jgi:hypothetical protein
MHVSPMQRRTRGTQAVTACTRHAAGWSFGGVVTQLETRIAQALPCLIGAHTSLTGEY